MVAYEFKLDDKGSGAFFKLSPEKLTLQVIYKSERYDFEYLDCVLNDRFTGDWFAGVAFQAYTVMYEGCEVKKRENGFELTGHPKRIETDEIISAITVTNRFTVLPESASVVQETFFKVDGAYYDTSPLVARVELGEMYFDQVGSEEEGVFFNVRDLGMSNPGYPKELVFKGKNRYLKVRGGLVAVCGKTLESHSAMLNYNDSLDYYNEENSVFTVFTFAEGKTPVLPERINRTPANPSLSTLESGELQIDYVEKEHSLALWHRKQEQPMAAMQIRHLPTGENKFLDTLSYWNEVSVTKRGNVTEFFLSGPEGILGIGLKLTAEAKPAQNRLEWDVTVLNDSEEYSLLWCTYPRLYCECKKPHHLFQPEGSGTEYKNFSVSDVSFNGSYPGGFYAPMAYMALYAADDVKEKGIYYGVHDPEGGKKEFQAASSQTGGVKLSCRAFAENWGKPKNTYHVSGKMVWQSFTGDWFDATEIYREFVLKECYWTKRNIDDKNTPMWMQDIPFWVMDWVPQERTDGEPIPTALRTDSDEVRPNDWYENVIRLQETFGVPIGFHVYNWHKIPFNNDYPHFMPAKKSFCAGMTELKKHDIRVMPYINALLWDTKDGGNADFEFESIGRAGAVKTENGDPIILRFESREADGSLVELTAMCPSYQPWRDKLVKLTINMFNELDVDAIYLDQVSARIPHLCMDETHGHPLGGGDWWGKAYNDLLAELNRNKPKDKAFTSEATAEVYASNLDGFLSWTWVRSANDVPAFMRVYSNLIKVFGRNTNGYMKHSHMHWKYHLAQSLLCGQQMGWVNADLVHMPDRLEYTKKLVCFRYANREFFRHVTVLRPPVVQAEEGHTFLSDVGMGHIGMLIKPYICAGALQNGKDRMILLVNVGKKTMTDMISFNPQEYNPGENFKVEGYGSVDKVFEGKTECTVEAESYLCIRWEAE